MTDESGLRAGVARADITPETGRTFQGYVRPDIRAEGVGSRLFARALVLENGGQKLALVSADLLFGIDREAVVSRVRSLGFSAETVLYAGTHTHAATEAGEWTAAQVARAIAAADANRRPARAGWATATVEDANQSRSLEAHLANHGLDRDPGTGTPALDPEGTDHPRDRTLRLLRVDGTDGKPIGVWTQFAVHPTAFTPHNTVYSADLAGAAVRQFAAGVPADEPPVTLFANGTEGDLIPVYDDFNQHAVAETVGGRLAAGMAEAWEAAGEALDRTVSLAGRATTATYEGQAVEGNRMGSRAVFGLPFFGGGENGPSFFYGLGLEGMGRPDWLADGVHGRKIPVAPAPWDPTIAVQVCRVGDRLLLAVPGEPTVEMGRRSREAVQSVAPANIADVAVVGLANGYNGYFTTPEEYDQQHYEGGHTTFGKYSAALLRQTFVDLAADISPTTASTAGETNAADDASDTETAGETEPAGDDPHTPPSPVGRAAVGALDSQPTGPVERFETVSVRWQGGPKGRDRPVGDPFVRVERQTADGWTTVETDLDRGFVWTVADGEYTARYEVPADLTPGAYRLRVTGVGYDLPTRPFEVVPSTALRILGVDRSEDSGKIRVTAQNPPPDPDRHLRSRPKSPEGGTVTLLVAGEEHVAEWDPDVGGWLAAVDAVADGDAVTVPAGGLEDGLGNRSGAETTLTVGEVAERTWPADLGPGGGRPPGPFGIGTWPI